MGMIEEIQQLKKTHYEGKVLSLYLNTDPTDPDQQGGKWKTVLKNGLNQLEDSVKEYADKDELKNFQEVRDAIEKYIFEHERQLKRSFVIFASADQSVWFFKQLQVRVKSSFYWEESGAFDQLNSLVKDYPRSGIILVQHNEIKVLETLLNESTHLKGYELDLHTEDWREKVGPRQGFHSSGLGAHNAQVDNFERRFEANQHRWFLSIAGKLDKLAKDQSWDQTYIVGETDVAYELEKAMNREVNEVIPKNMLDQQDDQIIQTIFE